MIKTLRTKFIKIAMLSISLVLIVIIGGINLASYINIDHNTDSRLELILENGGTFPKRPPEAPFFKDEFRRRGISAESPFDTRYFTVQLDSQGTVKVINTGRIAAVSTQTASEYATKLYQKNKLHGYTDCYKYLAKEQTDTDNNSMILYVFLDCSRELDSFRTFLLASIGVSLAGLLVFFLLVLFFSKQMVRPMAESYEKQKRFITDASHELKTPLTIIDANTEVIEMVSGENEWTNSTKKQVKRLAALTEKLVFLSRMDEEATKLDMIDFSLSEAVLDTVDAYHSLAAAQKKTLDIEVTPNIRYHGDEKNIRQLVSLLLDNAMKYSDEHGLIRLALYANGRSRILTVYNTVEHIETEHIERLFDRFYRTDASRNSKSGGFGIGLSVAQAIVNAHKGKIRAASSDGKSITFTVVL